MVSNWKIILPFMFSWQIYQSYMLSVYVHVGHVGHMWRHKSDLWGRHRCDTASSMSTIRPKYSTKMRKNTSFCAELNEEHAGEGFMLLQLLVLLTWSLEAKNHGICENLTFDLS